MDPNILCLWQPFSTFPHCGWLGSPSKTSVWSLDLEGAGGALGWRLFNKRNIMHAPRFLFPSEYTCARQVEMEEEESGGEEDAGPCEVFGVLRLPLKPGTASGYVGVQRIASKKRPWQATLKPPGRKRLNIGCFKTEQEAALARARAKADGSDILPSPRKQAARSSGARSPPHCALSALSLSQSLLITALLISWCVQQSSGRRLRSSRPSQTTARTRSFPRL